MQPEQLRIFNNSRLLQNEMRWACNILKNAGLDGSRLFLDISILTKFIQILTGQELPSSVFFDRSLPPVTVLRNILNYLHRFGIRTADINAVHLVSGTDTDRYKFLVRLHECFDPTTVSYKLGPLAIDISPCENLGSFSDSNSFRSNQQAILLAAELRAASFSNQPQNVQWQNNLLPTASSEKLGDIHVMRQHISASAIKSRPDPLVITRSQSMNMLSHISNQLGSVTCTLSKIDYQLGNIVDKMDRSMVSSGPKMTYSNGGFFRNFLAKCSCIKSKLTRSSKINRTKSVASTHNSSSLFATSV